MKRLLGLAILLGALVPCACSPPPPAGDVPDLPTPPDTDPEDTPRLSVTLGSDVRLAIGEPMEIEAEVSNTAENARLLFFWGYSLNLSGEDEAESLKDTGAVLRLDPAELFYEPDITFILQVRVLQIEADLATEATASAFVIVGNGPDPANLTDTGGELAVTLGPNLQTEADDVLVLEVEVTGALVGAELFYSWEILLDPQRGGQTVRSSRFAAGDSTHRVAPAELFSPEELLEGLIFVVRVRVLEVGIAGSRNAEDSMFISVGETLTPVDPDNGNDNGAANNNENANDNGNDNDNANENANANENGNDNGNGNDNDNGNENGNDNGNGNGNGNSNCNTNYNSNDNGNGGLADPCEGLSGFVVVMPDVTHMSMFEGTIRLQPAVCGGAPPFTYDWTPIDYLEDTGPLEAGASEITTEDADFTPPAIGDYGVTVTVTDAAMDTAADSTTVRVNDYDPLLADAGDDAVTTQDGILTVEASAMGGSGSYAYRWSPSGTNSATFVPITCAIGDTTHTVTATDTETGATATDDVRVVVLPAHSSSCTPLDAALAIGSAQGVAYDPNYGTRGQALIASGSLLMLYDLGADSVRASLTLPSDAQDVVVDVARRRAFASTRLSGQFTRSVQVINLDSATLGSNIGLTNKVASARGLAVVPTTGRVLVAASGAANGIMQINPDMGTLDAALQNVHHPGSFDQPIDVAVLQTGALSVAIVVNASSDTVTLVPLADITLTPDVPGGGGAALPRLQLDGIGRAVAADASTGQVMVAWNSGTQGHVQLLTITSNSSGNLDTSTVLPGAVRDLGLDINADRREAYLALGSAGVAVVNVDFAVLQTTLTGTPTSIFGVAATAEDSVLMVGSGSDLSERCP